MPRASRGEVWLVDLGLAAKVRPCLVLSIPYADSERALVTLIPHTTSRRESRFEVPLALRFLKEGAFDAQGILTLPSVKLIRRLGAASEDQLVAVGRAVSAWLGLPLTTP